MGYEDEEYVDTTQLSEAEAAIQEASYNSRMAQMEMREKQALNNVQSLLNEGAMSFDDYLDVGVRDDGDDGLAAREMKRKMGYINQHVAPQRQQQPTPMMEDSMYGAPIQQDGWTVVKQPARLKSGKTINVFVVEDALTGMTTGKKYRLSAVAEKIATVLNATNNPDDPRIQMIETQYNNHVSLMRKLNEAKRAGNRKQMSLIESKLQEVNARLGLG